MSVPAGVYMSLKWFGGKTHKDNEMKHRLAAMIPNSRG